MVVEPEDLNADSILGGTSTGTGTGKVNSKSCGGSRCEGGDESENEDC